MALVGPNCIIFQEERKPTILTEAEKEINNRFAIARKVVQQHRDFLMSFPGVLSVDEGTTVVALMALNLRS